MSLPEALAEDRAARESAYAHMLNRFVVPAAKLAELPDEMPGLSVVLSGAEDAARLDGQGIEAVELALGSPQPRAADLLAHVPRARAARRRDLLRARARRRLARRRAGRHRRDRGGRRPGQAALRRGGDSLGRAGRPRDRVLPRGGRAVQGDRRPASRAAPRGRARVSQLPRCYDSAARGARVGACRGGLRGARRLAPPTAPSSSASAAAAGGSRWTTSSSWGCCRDVRLRGASGRRRVRPH